MNSSLNEKKSNAKRKKTDPPDSEEVVIPTDATPNQDMVMEDQELYNPPKIRISARPSTPATRDNKKKSQ